MTKRRPLALGAAATIGFGSLFFASPALAVAEEAPAPTETTESQAAQDEVTSLAAGDKYELAAAQMGVSSADVQQLESAREIVVSDKGFVAHIDDVTAPSGNEFDAPAEAKVPGNPADGSRPGAPVTVYLDFDGETLEGTNWNELQGEETLTFAPAAKADAAFQARVWASVAEDYAPFNVNVTTTNPGEDALFKTSEDDNAYGSHVIVTDSYTDVLDEAYGTGGIAWGGGAGSDFLRGALVFTEGAGGADATAKSVAEIASHESGHNFGLEHDGHGSEEYYAPVEGLWGPIMGAGYEVPVTQWSNGDYAGATNDEDDLSVITDRSAAATYFLYLTLPDGTIYDGPVCPFEGSDPSDPKPGDKYQVPNAQNECDGSGEILTSHWTFTDRAEFAGDDHADEAANATALDNSEGTFSAKGVIGSTGDVDQFALTTEGGKVTATVEVADISANLNAKLTLTNAEGTVVAEDAGAPERTSEAAAKGLGASVTADNVKAGTYYLKVEGVGFGDNSNTTGTKAGGFSNYGSLGNYTLTGEAAPKEIVVEAPAITDPADGSTVTGPVTAISGTGLAGATVDLTGAVQGSATVAEDGTWTVEANLNAGEYTVRATQTAQGVTSEPTSASFTVKDAPKAPEAPVITSITDGQTFAAGEGPSGVAGTGTPGATVTVNVDSVAFTAEVDEDGAWGVEFGGALAAGSYELSAIQTVNGLDSEPATVSFTVEEEQTGTGSEGNADNNGANADSEGNADNQGTGGNADSEGNADNGGNGTTGGDNSNAGADGANGGSNGDDLANTGSNVSMLPFGLTAAGMLLLGCAVVVLMARRQKRSEA